MIQIFPSLISGNILNLEEEIKIFEPYCDGFHLDVMDFHFVDNLSFGPMFVNAIAKITSKQLCVHLMVDNPNDWIKILKLRKNDILIFHYEAANNHKNIIEKIHANNVLAGLALNLETNVDVISPIADVLDEVILMSVKPGFSGQVFNIEVLKKVNKLIEFKKINNYKFLIAIDGGINESNICQITKMEIDKLIIGSAIFNDKNPINYLEKLYHIINSK